MIIEVPATGERITALLIEDGCGMLCLKIGRRSGVIEYALKSVLDIGWRIVDSAPDELSLLEAHGLAAIGSP
jgi:hypothetical protein